MTRKPTSPGEMLLEEFLKPANLTQRQFAKNIGVKVEVINRLVNGAPLEEVLAQKIAAATNTSIELWMNLQNAVTTVDAKKP
jgi:addiction module HigA family antidote